MALLTGKLAFVTGAGSGIGRATCLALSRDGAQVIAGDLNFKSAQETVNGLHKSNNIQHLPIAINVSDSKTVQNALSTILTKYGMPPSIVVNSAGITRDNFLLKLSEEDFDEVIKINLKGTFIVMKTFGNALSKLENSQGSFINIASISGKISNIGQSNYNASKVGVEALTKTAAKEFGKFNIRCNSILPGIIMTPMVMTIPEKVKNVMAQQIPLRRFGKPEEIAEVITFLASEKSSYINGASIDVSGGMF